MPVSGLLVRAELPCEPGCKMGLLISAPWGGRGVQEWSRRGDRAEPKEVLAALWALVPCLHEVGNGGIKRTPYHSPSPPEEGGNVGEFVAQ